MTQKDAEQQLELIPEQVPASHEATVSLAAFEDGQLLGPPPSIQLVESVQRWGIMEPLILRERPTTRGHPGGYDIISGQRRIMAGRLAGVERASARVFDVGGNLPDVATLMLQDMRKANPAAELRAIEALVKAGKGLGEIGRATGLPVSTIEKRLKLASLLPPFRHALDTGGISGAVAEGLAGLPEALQARLQQEVYGPKGKLTARDIHDIRCVQVSDAVAELPDELFARPGANGEPVVTVGAGTLAAMRQAAHRLREIGWVTDTESQGILMGLLDLIDGIAV